MSCLHFMSHHITSPCHDCHITTPRHHVSKPSLAIISQNFITKLRQWVKIHQSPTTHHLQSSDDVVALPLPLSCPVPCRWVPGKKTRFKCGGLHVCGLSVCVCPSGFPAQIKSEPIAYSSSSFISSSFSSSFSSSSSTTTSSSSSSSSTMRPQTTFSFSVSGQSLLPFVTLSW